MCFVIGIDVGGSTTKIVGVGEEGVRKPLFVRAADPVASLFGALGKYTYDNGIPLNSIEKIVLTGVGSAYINQPLYGIPTAKADEFLADGLGATYHTDLKETIVVSMGTGTSLVQVAGGKITHIGGVGIGGGTITGLASLLLNTSDISEIIELAKRGRLENIDLQIRDITTAPLQGLPLDATASNFGKVRGAVSPEDAALGILNMVLQCIGKSAILSALNTPIRDFVLIGNLTKLPQCRAVFPVLEKMFGVRFLIPENAEYRTAVGAALAFILGHPVRDVPQGKEQSV